MHDTSQPHHLRRLTPQPLHDWLATSTPAASPIRQPQHLPPPTYVHAYIEDVLGKPHVLPNCLYPADLQIHLANLPSNFSVWHATMNKQHDLNTKSRSDHHRQDQQQQALYSPPATPQGSSPMPPHADALPLHAGPAVWSPPAANTPTIAKSTVAVDRSVEQALDLAREHEEGLDDPTIQAILDEELARIWDRVMTAPDSYVMNNQEFAVFNFFQHRFRGGDEKEEIARGVRRRYWDNREDKPAKR